MTNSYHFAKGGIILAQFSYQARTEDGKLERGVAEAADREALVHQLRDRGLYCSTVQESHGVSVAERPLKLKNLSAFCRQLAAMQHAGVSMARSLDTICESTSDKRTRGAAFRLYEGVLKGQSLSESMKQQGKVFPELMIYMTETGEVSGTLDQIMESMSGHYEREHETRKKAQSAMIYPVILSVVAVGVVIFLLTSIIPSFVSMYDGVELPWPTQILLNLSTFVQSYWGGLLAVLLGITVLITWLKTLRRVRIASGRRRLHTPILGKLRRTILTSRFSSTFSVLYSSGISILKSIDVTSRVLGNAYVEEEMKKVTEGLRRGGMLSAALDELHLFHPMMISMVKAGEESGALDNMMKKTGAYFEKEAQVALNQMVAMLEPLMIVIFGFIIGFIVISIILPIFGMYQQYL